MNRQRLQLPLWFALCCLAAVAAGCGDIKVTNDGGGSGAAGNGTAGGAGTTGAAGTTAPPGRRAPPGRAARDDRRRRGRRRGRGGTTGAAGTSGGRGGTTGAAGASGGRGGTTGAAGTSGGRGGSAAGAKAGLEGAAARAARHVRKGDLSVGSDLLQRELWGLHPARQRLHRPGLHRSEVDLHVRPPAV